MKKVFKYLAIALIGWAAISCAKNISEPQLNEEEDSPYMQTFTCTIAETDPDTKLAIDATGKTTWEPGDQILIHGEYLGERDTNSDGIKEKYSTVVTLRDIDITNEGKTATIRFAVDKDGLAGIKPYNRDGSTTTLYAAYPADVVKFSNGLHVYNYTDYTNTNRPLLVGYDKGDNTFGFENICSAISFIVPSQAPEDDFTSFEFAGNDNEIIGYSQYSVQRYWKTSGSAGGSKPYTWAGETNGEVRKITGDVKCDGVTKAFVYIVPKWVEDRGDGKNYNTYDVSFNSGFTIKFFKGAEPTHYIANLNSITLGSGKYLNLGDISSHIKQYTPAEDNDSKISIDGAYNLSASKTANCYLLDSNTELAANKVYKFKAVRGNSNVSVGTIKSVEVLWETYNNTAEVTPNSIVYQVDYDRHDGECYIVFKMPETITYGNAVIAAKNASGQILWSWHIWVPETTVGNNSYNNLFGSNVQDRNLGALRAAVGSAEDGAVESIKTYGLMYQWGRKDPFPGGGENGKNTKASTSKALEEKSLVQLTVAESIKHPTQFAYNAETAVDPLWNGKSWCSQYIKTLWDNGGQKGLYDPCPPGYKVPVYDSSKGAWIKDGWTYDKSNKWFQKDSAVFPLAGYLDDCSGSLEYSGVRNRFWGASSASEDSGYCFQIKPGEAGAFTHYSSTHKAAGASVRCVAE